MSRNTLISALVVILGVVALVLWRTNASDRKGETDRDVERTRRAAAAGSGAVSSNPSAGLDPRRVERASITGTVRDESGSALAGAQVCAKARSDQLAREETHEPACALSGPDGAYLLAGLLPAAYQVFASAASYLPSTYEDTQGRKRLWLAAGQKRADIDLQLTPGGAELTGAVLDIGGGPVANAWVEVTSNQWRLGSASFARSDEQGLFRTWTRPGRVSITASADGYAEGSKEGTAPGLHVEVLLTPESVLAGKVVEVGTERPVAGVLVAVGSRGVRWFGGDGEGSGSARTDDQGRFRINRLAPGRYKPTVSGAGVYGEPTESVLLGLGETRDDLLIEVHPAFAIAGRIVLEEAPGDGSRSAQACASGRLRLRDRARELSHSSESDEAGNARVQGLLPGVYQVQVTCSDYLAQPEYPDIEITDADSIDNRWSVTPGGEIVGTVRDRDGRPIAEAWTRASVTGGDPRGQRTWGGDTTGPDGRFSMKGLVAGKYDVSFGAPDCPEAREPTRVEVAGGERVEVELVADSGGIIVGTVVDESGQPLAGVSVAARAERWSFRGAVITGDDGSFRITGVRPGSVRVSASLVFGEELRAPGQSDDDAAGQEVTAIAGQEVAVRLVVESQGGEISGLIVDEQGQPIADGYVSVHRESDAAGANRSNARRFSRWSWYGRKPVLTDTEGRFTVTGLTRGMYTLRGYRRGGGEAFTEGVAVGSQVTLKIAATGSIAGALRRDDGLPPAEFSVVVQDRSSGFRRTERFFRVANGEFTIRDLPAGQFTVAAEAAEGVGKHEVALEQGQDVAGLVFTLETRVTVVGRMMELDGEQPVAGLMVFVQPLDGANAVGSFSPGGGKDKKFITDERGEFELERTPTGPAHLMAVPADFRNSPYSFARIPLKIRGTGRFDVGDIRIPRRRLNMRERPGDLGYTVADQPPDVDIEAKVIKVALVRPDGPAGKSGLAVDDVVESIDGHDVTGRHYFAYWALSQVTEGTQVTLGLSGGKRAVITAGPPR